MSEQAIRIVAPMILDVRASTAFVETETHVVWNVGYAPELDDDGNGRFILAHLHAANTDGRVDVEIGATQLGSVLGSIAEGEDAEQYESALGESEALETLYDIARITAKSLLGTVNVELDLPLASPAVEVTRLVRSTEALDTEHA